MLNFSTQWRETVARKQSLLCVGIDAAEPEQRAQQAMPRGQQKLAWTLELIQQVAPYAAAIKINRNYYKDISRESMQEINAKIHALDMLSIDDSKLADIGDTNDAGIYHAKLEGFDAVTYAPFPGNIQQAADQAKKHQIGLIVLVLMSNPEYRLIKEARVNGQALYLHLAQQAADSQVAGVVIGAPSPNNHITAEEIQTLAAILPESLILVPGIGAQGGDLAALLAAFGKRTIANVGRAIIYSTDPATQARLYRDRIAEWLAPS